jgi:hypothetical protein
MFSETDSSLQPGHPGMQNMHQAQFRQPLPPDVRPQARMMQPNVLMRPGQVRS